MDYSGKAPSFIKNIQSFLGNLRSGSFFNPIKDILDADRNNARPRNRFPFFVNKHRLGSHVHRTHHRTSSSKTSQIEAEQEHLRREREQILEERRELEKERKHLLDKVVQNQDRLNAKNKKKRMGRGTTFIPTPSFSIYIRPHIYRFSISSAKPKSSLSTLWNSNKGFEFESALSKSGFFSFIFVQLRKGASNQ